jgi:hypothetical protein
MKEGIPMRLLTGGVTDKYKKILGQICANLIGTSWHLVTQRATSVTINEEN